MARKRFSWWARGSIPGVRGEGEDALITGKGKPGLDAHRYRARRKMGGRTRAQIQDEQELRAHGVRVFDRNAGLSELGGYLAPRK